MESFNEMWQSIADRIGGTRGEEIVRRVKELYSVFGREIVSWQAELYSPEHGGFYFSNSARDNDSTFYNGEEHRLLPDVESTIASFGFMKQSGISGGREAKEFLPAWLRKRVADFVYDLQDEDGYFYHPQWGKNIKDLRKTRDLGTSIRLLRLDDRQPKYTVPTAQGSVETYDISKAPERFQSVEKFKKYLNEELDFKNKAYASASVLSSGLGELKNYGQMLKADLVGMVIEVLNRDQRPNTGFWTDTVDYNGTNAVHKVSKLYSWTGHKMPNIDRTIENTMKVMVSPDDPGSSIAVMNPWHVLGELISIKKRIYGIAPEEMTALMDRVYDFAPEAIRVTTEKIQRYRKSDGAYGVSATDGQGSAYGSIVAFLGTNESNINGNACASSALIDGVYFGLNIQDLKVPLMPYDALDEYLSIIERNERAWREKNGISTEDM